MTLHLAYVQGTKSVMILISAKVLLFVESSLTPYCLNTTNINMTIVNGIVLVK